MITLITAVPGSGKTHYSVSLIQGFLNEGRAVYTNIKGLAHDKFENNHLLKDAPNDWTETPDGSVVFYDECQEKDLYPATGQKGEVTDPRLKRLETHRHTGHDLFFITQAPTFVHHHVRKLVGSHVHFYRGSGMKYVAKYTWSHTCDSPNDRREQERADFSTYHLNPSIFPLYKSSTVHTHKFKLPRKFIGLALLIAGILAIVIKSFLSSNILTDAVGLGSDSEKASQPVTRPAVTAAAVPSSPPLGWLSDAPTVRPVGGCIASASACRCYTKDLEPLDLAEAQCRVLLRSPLPAQLLLPKKSV